MDVTAERAEKIGTPSKTLTENEEKKVKSPFRRRLLRAAVGVLGAEILAGGALWGKDQFDRFFARPTTVNQGEIPKPPPIEPDKPASEKAINKVPLAEITRNFGGASMEPYRLNLTTEEPYSFTLSFNSATIVDVRREANNLIWVAVATPGEKLERKEIGRNTINFDGSRIDHYFYKGFTAWILVTNDILVVPEGSIGGSQGIGAIESSLVVGKAITFQSSINQRDKEYQELNRRSFELLSNSLGKPNTDRSDQSFIFKANFAFIKPPT